MLVAIAFSVLVGLLVVFQIALAFGAPWGRFAWGGQHPGVLPVGHRIGSAVSVLIYGFIGMLALDRSGTIDALPAPVSAVGMWIVFGFFALSVVMNALSRSKPERFTMTPVALILAILALLIALAGPASRTFDGTVIDDGEPVFCTAVMESYPPQCAMDSPTVVGWDWDAIAHEQSQTVRWGSYHFTGVLDDSTITVIEQPVSPAR